jgi:homospermidine synthase
VVAIGVFVLGMTVAILTPLLTGGPGRGMIINLSVDTSSADLMDLCKDIDAFYIDTVCEPWPAEPAPSYTS